MAKWKLCRQTYGDDIYELTEGDEVTIGRGTQNTIILPSLNISRKHCVISVKKDEVIIEDLKSANGIFIGLKKIAPNTPFSLSNNDIIGLGWADGAPLAKVNDAEKFVFKLLKTTNNSSIRDRIQFETENEPLIIPNEITNQSIKSPQPKRLTPISKLSLKRKSNTGIQSYDESTINGLNRKDKSHSLKEHTNDFTVKKFKCNFSYEDENVSLKEPIVKMEHEDEQYEAFNIKQECFDDEVQIIDSDSDSEQWYIRLSQNSPRKSFPSFNESRKSEDCHQDSSYSQLDDDIISIKNEIKCKNESDEEDYHDDLFTVLPRPGNIFDSIFNKDLKKSSEINIKCETNFAPNLENACNDSREECKKTKCSPLSKPPINLLDETSNNRSIVDINKNNEKNIKPKTKNGHIEKSKDNKHFLPINPSVILCRGTSENKDLETCNKIINLKNSSNDMNKRNTETKQLIISDTETKKTYKSRKIQLTDHKSPSKKSSHNSKGKITKNNDRSKSKSISSSKIQITISQKEERKKKLREIATKKKEVGDQLCNSNLLKNEDCITNTSKISSKITTSNRGAFLVDSKELTCKPTKKTKVAQDNKKKTDTNLSTPDSVCKEQNNIVTRKSLANSKTTNQIAILKDGSKKCENKIKNHIKESKKAYSKHKTSTDLTPSPPADVPDIASQRRYSDNITEDGEKKKQSPSIIEKKSNDVVSKNETEKANCNISQLKQKEDTSSEKSGKNATKQDNESSKIIEKQTSTEPKLPHDIQIPSQKIKPILKCFNKTILKPMKENKEPNKKSNKRVTFSEVQPEIREFEIEQGNQMKKTCHVKSILLASQYSTPVFSLQKIALMKILRWNPQWLEEQNNFSEPPPILGHNNVPMAILHSFNSHAQYVELIGDLLLMEIWECLTQGYVKTRNENTYLQMRIESLPLVPPQRRGLELINLNVNVSVPTVQAHTIPREGEVMIYEFGEDRKIFRFFFVHNVRCLPSPPNNINSFYSISLQTSFTDKMMTLQRGAVIYGRSLAYINKDLRLFEAMEYLSRSPLIEVILNPQPRHFLLDEADLCFNMQSQWSLPLNDSQRRAVMCAVSAAYGERPRIHMIQGPPGTGKSRVICAIVMEYFYDANSKKQKNRGKILLCATSNAAVDELVIRLLDIRQSLPQPERLKLVRVGRVEAMHPRARDISSLKLAQRDAARLQPDPAMQPSSLTAEISLLEAKKNMWQTKATSAGDDARKAYCQNRVIEISKKIAMFRSGGGGAGCGPEQVAHAERRVLEGADVVLTTLASAHSHKMRGLAGRIALCVVDEAGQVIEPETLVPLTLGVTHLVLVGDPQQLPGFICSQRAKQHGLGESLFSRLSSCAEAWGEGGPILLDRQYRMHPHIADYPNRAFYEGRVQNDTAHTQALTLGTAPYFVLGISSGDNGQDASGANEAEAWGAARVAIALRSCLRAAAPPAAHSLAVITPYTAQRDLVRHHLRMLLQAEGCGSGGGEEGEVEVNTVDSFQGQERSVVVVSLARSHGLGFLAAAGRMNVMLTRAKHVLVLCLNPRALEKNPQWRSLVEDAQRRNMYGTLPIQMCRPPSIHQITNQDILQYLSCNPPANNARNNQTQQSYTRTRRRYKHYRRMHKHGRNC